MTFKTNIYDWVIGSTAPKLITGDTINDAVEKEKEKLAYYAYRDDSRRVTGLDRYRIEEEQLEAKNRIGQDVMSVTYKVTFFVRTEGLYDGRVSNDTSMLYATRF